MKNLITYIDEPFPAGFFFCVMREKCMGKLWERYGTNIGPILHHKLPTMSYGNNMGKIGCKIWSKYGAKIAHQKSWAKLDQNMVPKLVIKWEIQISAGYIKKYTAKK